MSLMFAPDLEQLKTSRLKHVITKTKKRIKINNKIKIS
eukprot:UN00078